MNRFFFIYGISLFLFYSCNAFHCRKNLDRLNSFLTDNWTMETDYWEGWVIYKSDFGDTYVGLIYDSSTDSYTNGFLAKDTDSLSYSLYDNVSNKFVSIDSVDYDKPLFESFVDRVHFVIDNHILSISCIDSLLTITFNGCGDNQFILKKEQGGRIVLEEKYWTEIGDGWYLSKNSLNTIF